MRASFRIRFVSAVATSGQFDAGAGAWACCAETGTHAREAIRRDPTIRIDEPFHELSEHTLSNCRIAKSAKIAQSAKIARLQDCEIYQDFRGWPRRWLDGNFGNLGNLGNSPKGVLS